MPRNRGALEPWVEHERVIEAAIGEPHLVISASEGIAQNDATAQVEGRPGHGSNLAELG